MSSYFDEDVPDFVLKSLFSKYDKDSSGSLTQGELRILLEDDLGIVSSETDTLSLLMDKDASQKVSYDEFREWMKKGGSIVKDSSKYYLLERAVQYFKTCDQDKSGALEENEFKQLMNSLGARPDTVHSALESMDKDHNGKISFHEFLRWLNWLPMSDL